MQKRGNLSFIIIGLAVVAAVGLMVVGRSSGVPELPGQTFVTQAAADHATIIDVRTPGEYAAGHLAGAININVEDPSFTENVAKLNPGLTYFVYCHSGNRSGQAVAYMKQHGFKNLSELAGGLMSNPTLSLVTSNPA